MQSHPFHHSFKLFRTGQECYWWARHGRRSGWTASLRTIGVLDQSTVPLLASCAESSCEQITTCAPRARVVPVQYPITMGSLDVPVRDPGPVVPAFRHNSPHAPDRSVSLSAYESGRYA